MHCHKHYWVFANSQGGQGSFCYSYSSTLLFAIFLDFQHWKCSCLWGSSFGTWKKAKTRKNNYVTNTWCLFKPYHVIMKWLCKGVGTCLPVFLHRLDLLRPQVNGNSPWSLIVVSTHQYHWWYYWHIIGRMWWNKWHLYITKPVFLVFSAMDLSQLFASVWCSLLTHF